MIVLVKSFKKELFMYKRLLTVTIVILGLAIVLTLLPIHGESEIYENVLRLHVIANSDTDEDQALKLTVRDEVLNATQELFSGCKTRDEAQEILIRNLDRIQAIAQDTVRAHGYSYPVSVSLGEEEYPTKNYESCCFPSGEYLSLQIKLGNADGQNWWCVLFPPMCVGAATNGNAFAEVGLTGDQYNIITQTETPKYKVRFKLLEAFEDTLG